MRKKIFQLRPDPCKESFGFFKRLFRVDKMRPYVKSSERKGGEKGRFFSFGGLVPSKVTLKLEV